MTKIGPAIDGRGFVPAPLIIELRLSSSEMFNLEILYWIPPRFNAGTSGRCGLGLASYGSPLNSSV